MIEVGGWMVSEYMNMLEVAAMVPFVQPKAEDRGDRSLQTITIDTSGFAHCILFLAGARRALLTRGRGNSAKKN